MRNILRQNKQPELTTAKRAEMIADSDAESREDERQEHEHAKELLGGLAASQNIEIEPEEDTHEK